MVLPQALNRGSKGGERSSERHPPSNQRKASGNTEIVRSKEEERVSFLQHEPKLKQIHHKGKVESVQSFLIKSPFSMGLPLRRVKLHCQSPCCGFS